uniref:Uncharacterized protein n=1 Tax=Lactuca sativa TaxID=4236 RepID=A0A9R1VX36_LACSA|nr:hypothetical protein LSAT_V11C400213570 [Lactuca sativa]
MLGGLSFINVSTNGAKQRKLDSEVLATIMEENDIIRASLLVVECKEMKDTTKKAKLRWSIEGDENSKFNQEEKKMMILKTYFEKAYESVSWEYLDRIMQFMNFGVKWRNWIWACLSSMSSLILINGSHSVEFQLQRRASCCYLKESNLFRIGMDWKEIVYFSGLVWCKPDKLPFDYLGLPVGQNMSRIVNWKSGGNDDSFMMPWVKWDLVLTDKSRRGFNIGSLVVDDGSLIMTRFFGLSMVIMVGSIRVKDVQTRSGRGLGLLTPPLCYRIKVGDQLLSISFPCLYRWDTDNQCSIFENRYEHGWIWQWHRPIRGGDELITRVVE